jgi:hypothetical protein
MGWSDTSSMASVYTRRHIRKKAKDASLACKLNCAWEKNNGI